MTDFDMHCGVPDSRWFLACQNMGNYSFTGISFFGGCQQQLAQEATAHQLTVEESCVWVCKHKRPVARCEWKFTHPVGSTDRLDMCWLSELCIGGQVRVYAACKPHELFNASEDLAALRQDLEAAKAAHQEATQQIKLLNQSFANSSALREDLEEAQAAHELAKERLASMVAELNRTREQLAQKTEEHVDVRAELLRNQRMRTELSRMFEDARRELFAAQAMLRHQNESHTMQRKKHFEELRNLLMEAEQQRQILEFHKATDRASELLGHPEKMSEERPWFIGAVVVLSVFLVGCTGIVAALAQQHRKWRKLALSQAGQMGAHVVLGRPVGADNNSAIGQAYPVKPEQARLADANAVEAFKEPYPPPSPKVAWT